MMWNKCTICPMSVTACSTFSLFQFYGYVYFNQFPRHIFFIYYHSTIEPGYTYPNQGRIQDLLLTVGVRIFLLMRCLVSVIGPGFLETNLSLRFYSNLRNLKKTYFSKKNLAQILTQLEKKLKLPPHQT